MADWADRAVEQQGRQGHLRADPLKGVNIEREYKLIQAELCKFSPRIQDLIVERYESAKLRGEI